MRVHVMQLCTRVLRVAAGASGRARAPPPLLRLVPAASLAGCTARCSSSALSAPARTSSAPRSASSVSRNAQYDDYVRRSADLEAAVADALAAGDRLRALELLEDACDMGARPCRRCVRCAQRESDAVPHRQLVCSSIEMTIRLLCSTGDAENAHRAQVLLRRYGYDAGPMSLANLLMVYGTQMNAKGVHECLRDLERLSGPLGDGLISRMCFALMAVGCRDAAFRGVDATRAAGGTPAEVLRFILKNAGALPSGHVCDAVGMGRRRAFALDAQRRVLTYLLLAHAHAPTAAPEEVMAWIDVVLHKRSITLLVEGLSYKKIADALDADRLLHVFSALLRSFRGSLSQHRESVHDMHVVHTLEEFAMGARLNTATLESRVRLSTVFQWCRAGGAVESGAASAVKVNSPSTEGLLRYRDGDGMPSVSVAAAAMAAAVRARVGSRATWVLAAQRSADEQYVGPTFASLEGAVPFTTWRHDSTLRWTETYDRQLRFLVGMYLRLEALGASENVASAHLVQLFELLLRRRKLLAALQVATTLEARGILFLDAVPLHRLFVQLAHQRFDAVEKARIMHRLAAQLLPQELLDLYRAFLLRRPGLKRRLIPCIPTSSVFSLAQNAPQWVIKRAPLERSALVHTKRGGKTPGALPPMLFCDMRTGAGSKASATQSDDSVRSPSFVLITHADTRGAVPVMPAMDLTEPEPDAADSDVDEDADVDVSASDADQSDDADAAEDADASRGPRRRQGKVRHRA